MLFHLLNILIKPNLDPFSQFFDILFCHPNSLFTTLFTVKMAFQSVMSFTVILQLSYNNMTICGNWNFREFRPSSDFIFYYKTIRPSASCSSVLQIIKEMDSSFSYSFHFLKLSLNGIMKTISSKNMSDTIAGYCLEVSFSLLYVQEFFLVTFSEHFIFSILLQNSKYFCNFLESGLWVIQFTPPNITPISSWV